jgi:hypothetical protein
MRRAMMWHLDLVENHVTLFSKPEAMVAISPIDTG